MSSSSAAVSSYPGRAVRAVAIDIRLSLPRTRRRLQKRLRCPTIGVMVADVREGHGSSIHTGDLVVAHIVGFLEDGWVVFDVPLGCYMDCSSTPYRDPCSRVILLRPPPLASRTSQLSSCCITGLSF